MDELTSLSEVQLYGTKKRASGGRGIRAGNNVLDFSERECGALGIQPLTMFFLAWL